MRTDDPGRRFSREVKLAAVQRIAAGANVSKLARELGISRKAFISGKSNSRLAERRCCENAEPALRRQCARLPQSA
ncbi:transposase-like protein [Rhizobium mesoamericanum]|uniref:transposase n=1 Tax=Rhizobium mesoamericanum TaxID=1079800 RepID=UPI0027829A03|nr:transposase-like protein [Rhizobium mesoamericanum]